MGYWKSATVAVSLTRQQFTPQASGSEPGTEVGLSEQAQDPRLRSLLRMAREVTARRDLEEVLAERLRFACENVGFLYAVNHGVPQAVIDRGFAASQRFHALPLEEKLRLRLNQNNIGFHSYTEPMLCSDGNELVRDILVAVLAALAKAERVKISERTRAGLDRVRREGSRVGGQPSRPKRGSDLIPQFLQRRAATERTLPRTRADPHPVLSDRFQRHDAGRHQSDNRVR